MCDISGHIMSKHHLVQHMDKHCITKRFECHEKIGKNAICKKASKQKSALIRHLIEKHNKSNIELANIKIKDESECYINWECFKCNGVLIISKVL